MARLRVPTLETALAAFAFSSAALADATHFEDVTKASFPKEPCAGPDNDGCYTNFVMVADLNNDGSPDLLFANGGGYFEAGSAEPSSVYLNDGHGAFIDVTAPFFDSPSSRLRQVAVGDVDGDGRVDVYMPGGYGIDRDKLFIQLETGAFRDEAASRLPKDLMSRAGATHFGDVDDDGDLDLVVADWGLTSAYRAGYGAEPQWHILMYLNDGRGHFSPADDEALSPPLPAAKGNTVSVDIDLHDVDGDFDLDIILDNRNGQNQLLLNDGQGLFYDATPRLPAKQGSYSYNVEGCDIDGDGDLDLLLDNAASRLGEGHDTQVLINDGHGSFADQTRGRITGEPTSDDNIVKCVDVDDDGDFDLLVGSLSNDAEKLLLNDGSGRFTYTPGAIPAISDPSLALGVGDFDGDGRIDFVTGQGEGTPRQNRIYHATGQSHPDTHPPVFRRIQAPVGVHPGMPIVLHMAVSDAYTSEVGQQVKSVVVDYRVGDVSGSAKAAFMGGDLFRAVIPPQGPGTMVTMTVSATDRGDRVATAGLVVAVEEADAGVQDGDAGAQDGGAEAGDAGPDGTPGPIAADPSANSGCHVHGGRAASAGTWWPWAMVWFVAAARAVQRRRRVMPLGVRV